MDANSTSTPKNEAAWRERSRRLPSMATAAALLAVLLMAPAASPLGPRAAQADEVFVVDTLLDGPATAADCTAPVANACSLRDAVAAANAAGPGTHTINLPAGVHTLTEGQLLVSNTAATVRILGASLDPADTTIRRDPNSGAFRLLRINAGVALEIEGVTLTGGHEPTVSGGGGIFSSGTLAISRSEISGNQSANAGGGILNVGDFTVSHSTIAGNTSAGNGGGIASNNSSAVVTIIASTINGNNAGGGGGGGIHNNFGTVNVTNSTISDNQAINAFNNSSGGGILNNNGGHANLTNTTVTNNIASIFGRGIFNSGGSGATLRNSIVAGQQAAGDCAGPGAVTADAFNLDSDGTCDASTTQADAGDFLGPLADNGGPTLTHALLPGSAAINAGDNTICGLAVEDDGSGPNDQRSPAFVRSFGASCDIGAFELQPVGKLRLTKALQPSSDAGKFGFEIDGVQHTPYGGIGDGGGTGQEIVPAGSRTVEETLVSGAPSLAHYFTAISCAATDGAGAPLASGTGASLSVPVAEGVEVACVFTNTRIPEQCLGMTFDRAVVGAGSIYGTAQRDLLIGSDGSDLIVGGAGDDCIDGGGGNDILRGDAGNDVVLGGAGVDNIQGGAGNDELHGGPGNDVIVGNEGNDSLYGDLGAAGAGQVDQLDGSAGTDLCKGTIRVRCEQQ